jgi:glutaminase
VNPLTRERVVDEETCRHVLAVMTTAGLYQSSGALFKARSSQ